jgi:hypothetical protein
MVAVVFTASLVFAAVLAICPKCGYENAAEAGTCTHCAASLGGASADTVSDPNRSREKGGARGQDPQSYPADAALVEKELEVGLSELTQSRDAAVAAHFFRNALSIRRLVDPATLPSGQAERIQKVLRQCEGARKQATRPCSTCEGSGKRVMKTPLLNGEFVTREVAGQGCLTCNGRGTVYVAARVSEQKLAAAQAYSRYKTLQQGRLYVAVGDAWLPADMAGALSVPQVVQVRKAVLPPCKVCGGVGLTECKTCGGSGMVKCSDRRCISGTVEVKGAAGLTQDTIVRREKCKACGGDGRMDCSACGGSGGTVCSACGGSGEPPECKRCGGQGTMACSRCAARTQPGVGVCATCKGDQKVLCPGCHGDGVSQ